MSCAISRALNFNKNKQVKKIIIQSGLPSKTSVIVSGDPTKALEFSEISSSGKMANAYNAMILADGVAKGRISI